MRSRNEFARAYRTGSRRRCGPITVIVAQGGRGTPCVGFVAGKRVGTAVERNRAKRRMREAASRCTFEPDTLYVLVADRGVLTSDFASLVEWIGAGSGSRSSTKEKL